jgi:hypothetical protein
MTTAKKSKLILYLSGVFIVAQVAANIGGDSHVEDPHFTAPYANDPELDKKIIAFKKGGVEKKINTSDYDIEAVIEFRHSS